jgi:hypothetical protein
MTIFDFISNIAFTKNKNCLNSIDEESEFQPFLVNRWLSMYSSELAKTSNILNKYIGIFESKKDLFALFCATFPRVSSKKITYFKKNKEPKDIKNDEIIIQIAKNKELSQREIRNYIGMLEQTDIDKA